MSAIEAAMLGALGRDAEVKTSKAGKTYLRLNIRVGDGEGCQWVSATIFDEKAITAADKMVKGARVYIEGRIALDEWTNAAGEKRHGLSVMSWHCRLAQIGRNRPNREQERAKAASTTAASTDFHDEIPF
jgi:single-stranded DNA-binding protein